MTENTEYLLQLMSTSAFCATFTQVVKPLVKEMLPKSYKIALPVTSCLAGVAFQFRLGIGEVVSMAMAIQMTIDGIFGGLLASGGYSLTDEKNAPYQKRKED